MKYMWFIVYIVSIYYLRTARSTGNPVFFREFFTEKFITVNAQGNLSEGPGGGKGYAKAKTGGSP